MSRGTRPSWSRDQLRCGSTFNIDRLNTANDQKGGRGNDLVNSYGAPVHRRSLGYDISRLSTAVFRQGSISFAQQIVFHSARAWARIVMATLCRPDAVPHNAMEVALLFQGSQMFIRCDVGRVDHLEAVQDSETTASLFKFSWWL